MRLLVLVAALALSANAHGQGPFEFTAQLTSPTTDLRGHGTFTLTENLFTYDVTGPWGYEMGEIRGPGPFPEAPLLFDLHLRGCEAPLGTFPGGCFFRGTMLLSDLQVEEVLDGQWYVRTFRSGPGVQGPIVLVPEPSPFILLALGLGLVAARGLVRAKQPVARTTALGRIGRKEALLAPR